MCPRPSIRALDLMLIRGRVRRGGRRGLQEEGGRGRGRGRGRGEIISCKCLL